MASDEATEELDARRQAELVLSIVTGGEIKELRLPARGEITIGRSRECDVQLDDPAVSSRHAVLRVAPLAIRDEGSRNGLSRHGRRLPPGELVPIAPREVIEIGSGFLSVRPARTHTRAGRIWSHDYVEGRIEEECARRERTGGSFALIRLRLPAGSDAAASDQAMVRASRGSDVVGRYAPGEYWLLLLDVDDDELSTALGRLRAEVAHGLHIAPDAIGSGVAVWPRDGTNVDELVARAAAALADRAGGETGARVVPGSRLDQVVRELGRVAPSDLSVLILGETGVGKELCAEAVHRLSRRHAAPLLRLNCAAFPAEMLEGELFGYERGAFTGAQHAKPGLFEAAAGGTVFIDEVGDLPLAVQLKLLRVIDSREVMRLGALRAHTIDVRFVAATHRDLDVEIASGRFREDLYYRLSGCTVHVPPLRERQDEIPALVQCFIERAAARLELPPPMLTSTALGLLVGYPWPGNIRELRNVIERAVVLAGRGPIDVAHLPGEKIRATVMSATPPAAAAPRPSPAVSAPRPASATLGPDLAGATQTSPVPRVTLDDPDERPTLRAAALRAEFRDREKEAILDALQRCAGNQSRAAVLLGMSRGTLLAKLDQYGIPRPRK